MYRNILNFLQQKTSRTCFAVLASLAVLLTCGLSFSLPYAEPDLWGHVQFGRDTLQHGLPRTTSYSFTANGFTWINHENLSEITFALAVDRLGVWSLLVAKCLLGIFIVALIGWRARRNGSSWLVAACAALLFAATVCSYWQVRPQLASFGFFALILLLLDTVFHGWDRQWHLPYLKKDARFDQSQTPYLEKKHLRWLWLAAPVFALWANSHGGFVAGYCFFAAYLLGRSCELWYQRGERAWETIGQLGVIAVVAGLSTLATPYGIDLHRWLLASLGSPRPEITEWHPLNTSSEAFLPLVTLGGISILSLTFSRRALDATHLLLLSLVTWQAVSHQRHVPFATLAICFWLPTHWNSFLQRLHSGVERELNPPRWAQFGMIGANVLLLCLLIPRLTWLRVDRSHYPVAAVEYMNNHELEGRLVVTYNWAQYLIGAFGEPDLPSATTQNVNAATSQTTGTPARRTKARIQVAFDGRFRTCYPQTIVDEHFDFVLGPNVATGRFRTSDVDPFRTLRTGHPDLVLISRKQVPATNAMRQQTDWVLLYQDTLAQLWGRKDRYADLHSDQFIPVEDRLTGDMIQEGYAAWPALPVAVPPAVAESMETDETLSVSLSDKNRT